MKKNVIFPYLGGVLTVFVILGFSGIHFPSTVHGDMDHQREHFIDVKNNIISKQILTHDYRCCLENPCNTCISLTPHHGEGATCDCLKDIINGEAPCGECVGGILAGRGNPYLAEYYATAISEKVGKEYKETLKKIISERYDIPVEKQI